MRATYLRMDVIDETAGNVVSENSRASDEDCLLVTAARSLDPPLLPRRASLGG